MTVDVFNSIAKQYGDQSLPDNEKWKSLMSFSIAGSSYPIDFATRFQDNMAYYVENASFGSGFLLLEPPHSDLEVLVGKKQTCCFIPIEYVVDVAFRYLQTEESGGN